MYANAGMLGPDALAALIEEKVKASGTSFYWGMRMLEVPRRRAMYAVYAFCREVDDVADEDVMVPEERLRRLEIWRQEVGRVFKGDPDHPVAMALVEAVATYGLRAEDLLAVIDGCAMDAQGVVTRPPMAVLDLYCDRVACAVGRLSVRVFGTWTPACDDVAAALGRALQLTNILRDVEEDAGMGRLYLPDELLASYGIQGADPAAVLAHPLLPLVRRDLAQLARGHFADAAAAMARSPRRTMRPAALMCATYRAVLDKLEAGEWATGNGRVRLPVWRKLWYAVRHGIL